MHWLVLQIIQRGVLHIRPVQPQTLESRRSSLYSRAASQVSLSLGGDVWWRELLGNWLIVLSRIGARARSFDEKHSQECRRRFGL